jgi:hypothetical protein
MIFEEARQELADQDRSDERQIMLQSLFSKFRCLFSTIQFQLAPNFLAVNGDAAIVANERVVHLFGGLAFHPRVTSDALTFALLHETGHHLAPGHRSPWDPRLACECAADSWAATTGTHLFHPDHFDLAVALKELELATGSVNRHAKRTGRRRVRCWATCWNQRKRCLQLRASFPRTPGCPLAQLVLRRQG